MAFVSFSSHMCLSIVKKVSGNYEKILLSTHVLPFQFYTEIFLGASKKKIHR